MTDGLAPVSGDSVSQGDPCGRRLHAERRSLAALLGACLRAINASELVGRPLAAADLSEPTNRSHWCPLIDWSRLPDCVDYAGVRQLGERVVRAKRLRAALGHPLALGLRDGPSERVGRRRVRSDDFRLDVPKRVNGAGYGFPFVGIEVRREQIVVLVPVLDLRDPEPSPIAAVERLLEVSVSMREIVPD
jgi:hypothetical protein